MAKSSKEKPSTSGKNTPEAVNVQDKLILNGSDIVSIGESAELLVGGKNYNTAIISQIEGIKAPQFRAVSSIAFHKLLDEGRINASLARTVVEREYRRIDWEDPEISGDPEFLQKLVRNLGHTIAEEAAKESASDTKLIMLRTFINNIVDGFATSPEGIDQLRKRSVLVQAAI